MKIFSKWRQRKPNNVYKKSGISVDEQVYVDLSDHHELPEVSLPKITPTFSFASESFNATHDVKRPDKEMAIPENLSDFLSHRKQDLTGGHGHEMSLLMYHCTIHNAFLSIGTLGEELLSKLEAGFISDEPSFMEVVDSYNESNVGVKQEDSKCQFDDSIINIEEKIHVLDIRKHACASEDEWKTLDGHDEKLTINGLSSAAMIEDDDKVQVQMLRHVKDQDLLSSNEVPLELMCFHSEAAEVDNHDPVICTKISGTEEPGIPNDKKNLKGAINAVNENSCRKMRQMERCKSSKPEIITESSSPRSINATHLDYLPTFKMQENIGSASVAQGELEKNPCLPNKIVTHIGKGLSPLGSNSRDHDDGSNIKCNAQHKEEKIKPCGIDDQCQRPTMECSPHHAKCNKVVKCYVSELLAAGDSENGEKELKVVREKVDCTCMNHLIQNISQGKVGCNSSFCDPQDYGGFLMSSSYRSTAHLMGAFDYSPSSIGFSSSSSLSACSTPTSVDIKDLQSKGYAAFNGSHGLDNDKEETIDYEMATLSCLKVISVNYHLDLKRLIVSVTPTYLAKHLLKRLKHIGLRRQPMCPPADRCYQSKFYKFLRTFRMKHKLCKTSSSVLKRELGGDQLALSMSNDMNHIEGINTCGSDNIEEELQTIKEELEEEMGGDDDEDEPSSTTTASGSFRQAQGEEDVQCENWINTDDEYVVLELEGNKDIDQEREINRVFTKTKQERDRHRSRKRK